MPCAAGQAHCANHKLPILVADSEVIQGSGRILDWAGVSGGDVELEERFDRHMGLLVRQYIYAATLSESSSGVRAALLDGVSTAQACVARLMWPVTRRLMIAGMNARPALIGQVEEQLGAELDWFDHRLDGRRYLVGDRLGRADITAASLLGPLARPAACPLYGRIVLPARVEETLARWRRRPSLAWTERLYADHRR